MFSLFSEKLECSWITPAVEDERAISSHTRSEPYLCKERNDIDVPLNSSCRCSATGNFFELGVVVNGASRRPSAWDGLLAWKLRYVTTISLSSHTGNRAQCDLELIFDQNGARGVLLSQIEGQEVLNKQRRSRATTTGLLHSGNHKEHPSTYHPSNI